MSDLLVKRPPPADADIVSKIARIGPIGRCLEDALNEIIFEDRKVQGEQTNEDDGEMEGGRKGRFHCALDKSRVSSPMHSDGIDEETDGGRDHYEENRRAIQIDNRMAQKLLRKFGEAVSLTTWDASSNGTAQVPIPPAALLRGNIDHYNRVGSQWRIVVNNARIRPRENFDASRKRKKRDRQSLWDRSVEETGVENTVKTDGKLQLLAYDDL